MRNSTQLERVRLPFKGIIIILASLFLTFSIMAFGQENTSPKAEIYEVLDAKIPKRGIYKHYYEFLANAPSITDSFYVRKTPRPYYLWQDTHSLEPRFVRKNKKVKNVWGFSDGEHTYIFDHGEFFPIVVEKGKLLFYGFDRVDNTGVLATTLLVGVVGGGISASGARNNAESQKIGYIIHPKNGTPIHPHNPFIENNEPKNVLIIYRKWQQESELTAKFLVNGDQLYSFETNSYVFLKYPLSQGIITLCTGADYKECITVALNPDVPTYVKCTYLMDAEIPTFLIPTQSQGRFDFGKVEKAQNKRGKQIPVGYDED